MYQIGYFKRSTLKDILDAQAAATALLDGAKLHVFKNDYTPSPSSVLADFEEADFTGYAAVTLDDWGEAFLQADGSGVMVHSSIQFTPSGTAIDNTVYGWYITDTAGTGYIAAGLFEEPVSLASNDDAAVAVPALILKAA